MFSNCLVTEACVSNSGRSNPGKVSPKTYQILVAEMPHFDLGTGRLKYGKLACWQSTNIVRRGISPVPLYLYQKMFKI